VGMIPHSPARSFPHAFPARGSCLGPPLPSNDPAMEECSWEWPTKNRSPGVYTADWKKVEINSNTPGSWAVHSEWGGAEDAGSLGMQIDTSCWQLGTQSR